MKKQAIFGAIAAIAVTATAAYAAVIFNQETGQGFVGKGDVQIKFGWNNAVAQAQANNVSFSYNSTDTYDVKIEFDTGVGTRGEQHHTVTQGKSTSVSATVASDPRKTGQYTGWNLTGLGATTVTGDAIPTVGDSCPNGDLPCQVTGVALISSTGGLYVSDTATSQGPTQIWP
jgi:hypothetical protein